MSNPWDVVRQAIESRRTAKVLSAVDQPVIFQQVDSEYWDRMVKQAVTSAGLAPFHYVRGFEGVAEPWRAYFLDWQHCRQLSRTFSEWADIKPSNKIPAMLSACGCLLLVTWIPQFRDKTTATMETDDSQVTKTKQTQIDDEHLAATAAFVQNILTLVTAAGLGSYWSSGGELGSLSVFQRLEIKPPEKLLAALFIEYPQTDANLERISGKNHPLRSPAEQWFKDLKLPFV